jgi:hypothetical protein
MGDKNHSVGRAEGVHVIWGMGWEYGVERITGEEMVAGGICEPQWKSQGKIMKIYLFVAINDGAFQLCALN